MTQARRDCPRHRAARSLIPTVPAVMALLAGILLCTGCSGYGIEAPLGPDTVSVALPSEVGGGAANLFLYRITSRETGERLGVGRQFGIEERRQVRAVLELTEVDPGTPLLLHVMWINPDGKEMYTKELYVSPEDWTDPARRDSLSADHLLLDDGRRRVELESRYGVGLARLEEQFHKDEEQRHFKAGTWTVRTYLFRKRLLQMTFELTMPE